jgi:hypothetical protein
LLRIAATIALAVIGVSAMCAEPQESPPVGTEPIAHADSIVGLANAWANSLAFSDWSRARHAPQLSDFRIDTSPRLKPAPFRVPLRGEARRFRTVLSAGALTGPNFADSLTVVHWGCGSPCVRFAILDARSGRVVFGPSKSFWAHPPLFTRWSTLLVDDGNGFALDSLGHPRISGRLVYYQWTRAGLTRFDSIAVEHVRIYQPD